MGGENVSENGETSADDDPHSSRPSTSRTDKIVLKRGSVHSSRCVTVHDTAEKVSISETVCHAIIMKNLGIIYIGAKLVLCLLTDKQKQILVDVSQELLNHANEDGIFLLNMPKMRHGCNDQASS